MTVKNDILKILYDRYFENYIIGYHEHYIREHVDGEPNDISRVIGELESDVLIERDGSSYKITTLGIEDYEMEAIPSEVSDKITQRRLILAELKKEYDIDIEVELNHESLAQRINSQDKDQLLSQVVFLEQTGMVILEMALGGTFDIRLNATGARLFETEEIGTAEYNENGYETLFKLENHLRKFIERKLKESFGATWWSEGIISALQTKADSRKTQEQGASWPIAITSSDMEFLEFPDLGRIIVNNWTIFESVFSNQNTITTKLNELDTIRNAIAHTRTLSGDSFSRLDMYSTEIFQMTDNR